jgi:hypothetical protein
MRFFEFNKSTAHNILVEAKVGREYQHLEDLVFVDGSKGAMQAADILEKLGSDNSDVAIKWDGNPTIYWGREPNGEFVLVGKNGWGKNKSTSPENLKNFITTSGKGEDWREKFGSDMAEIFQIMQQATPEDFRGYVFGDLLYHPGKPYKETDDAIQFTPNLVTYTVDKNSNLGQRIADSSVGIAAHGKYDEFGDKAGQPISDVEELNGNQAVVLGQTYVTHQPKVDVKEVGEIRAIAKRNAEVIDSFLEPRQGLSDMKNIIYTYVNQMSRSQNLANLENNFFDWLANSKVSANKQKKIQAIAEDNPKALPAIFGLVKKIMAAKDHIIDQLDSAEADVTASTKGEKGGEGYVALDTKTKLVPRTRWQPN